MKISFNLLIRILLPRHKRQPVRLKWLSIFAEKAKQAMERINDIIDYAIKALNVSCQVASLQFHLNLLYGPGIMIIHYAQPASGIGLLVDGLENFAAVGLPSEESPLSAGLLGEGQQNLATDYQVIVPHGVNISALRAELEKFRLAGKTFEIIISQQ